MTALRLFTDEDVYNAVAVALRRANFNAVTTPEASRLGQSDESQLSWAASEGRALVTFNVAHFAQLHVDWLRNGRHHAGIIVSSQRSIRDVVRRLSNLAKQLEAESLHDRLEFLSDW